MYVCMYVCMYVYIYIHVYMMGYMIYGRMGSNGIDPLVIKHAVHGCEILHQLVDGFCR